MNELNVVVQEEPCKVNWNFEDLKAALAEQMSVYETMIYDDDSVPAARTDVANLRKLRKAVEDKRIETKKACMEPYNVFEAQVKELTGLIDKPINYIDGQIKQYEAEEKEKRRNEIQKYMKEHLQDIDPKVAAGIISGKYDPRWENKTCSKKKWQEEANKAIQEAHDVMDQIAEMPEEFREPCTVVYERTLDPARVMAKQTELQAQKKAIEEAMQKKIEAENRRIQEQEMARQEAQAAKATEQKPAENGTETVNVGQKPSGMGQKAPEMGQKPSTESGSILLRIDGTENQIERIKGYIEFIGAGYEEVRA